MWGPCQGYDHCRRITYTGHFVLKTESANSSKTLPKESQVTSTKQYNIYITCVPF